MGIELVRDTAPGANENLGRNEPANNTRAMKGTATQQQHIYSSIRDRMLLPGQDEDMPAFDPASQPKEGQQRPEFVRKKGSKRFIRRPCKFPMDILSKPYEDFGGELTHSCTAHPRKDHRTGELYVFSYSLDLR